MSVKHQSSVGSRTYAGPVSLTPIDEIVPAFRPGPRMVRNLVGRKAMGRTNILRIQVHVSRKIIVGQALQLARGGSRAEGRPVLDRQLVKRQVVHRHAQGFAQLGFPPLARLPLPGIDQVEAHPAEAGAGHVKGSPRLGSCVAQPRNFIAIGLNYSDHAAEAGMPIPSEPIIFNKAPSSICGPNDDTFIPKDSLKLDWEVEIGIVIGKRARYLTKENTKAAIAGYFLSNDVSERNFQIDRSGGQWGKGKGSETFGPIGPWFVTKDEVTATC